MNSISNKSLLVIVVLGLVLPLVLGGILSALGVQPSFGFLGEDAGLFTIFSSGSGWMVYIVCALLFMIAGVVPSALDGSEYVESEEGDDDDGRETGEVKWFNPNKGYGFITRSSGEEIFVHFRSIRGRGHRTLRQGQNVRFKATEGEKGLQAEDVTPVKKSR